MHMFRLILAVGDIGEAASFYQRLLGVDGERVTSGRHYFDCDGVLLACWDALADGDPAPRRRLLIDPTNSCSTVAQAASRNVSLRARSRASSSDLKFS